MFDILDYFGDHYCCINSSVRHCTARQCSPLRRIFMDCYIINPALSLLMKHLVIGQRRKAPNFSAFHWSPHGSLVSIGQHFVTTRVVHLPKRTETSLITESDQRASNHQLCSYARPAQPGPNSQFRFHNLNFMVPAKGIVLLILFL